MLNRTRKDQGMELLKKDRLLKLTGALVLLGVTKKLSQLFAG